jgi:hypothetical protein
MRISTTPNATPQSTPPSSAGRRGGADASAGAEQFIWHSLVPRLVHPVKLQIVEALIQKGDPMTAEELASGVLLAEGNTDLIRYHAKAMTEAGTLEVADAKGDPSFFFSLPK